VGEENFPDLELEATPVDGEKKQSRKKFWLTPLVVGTGIGAAIAFGGMRVLSNRPTTAPANASTNAVAQKPAPSMTVTLATAQTASVERTVTATGSIAARDLIPVLPQTNGLQIKQILVNEGDLVKAGQVMAVLDDSLLQEQIRQAKADVESKEADTGSRLADIQSKQVAIASSENSVISSQAAFASSQAALASSQASVEASKATVAQRMADLKQQKAKLIETEKNLDRYERLFKSGAISEQEVISRRTAVVTAQETVQVALANIRSAESNVAIALANVKSAEAKLRIDLQSINNAKAAVNTAKANLEMAKANADGAVAVVKSTSAKESQLKTQLAQTLVRAPVSGIVGKKLARVGDMTGVAPQSQVGTVVGGSQQLFSIIREGSLELQAQFPETLLPQIKVGARVQINSDSNNRNSLRGTIREIEPVVNQQRREATIKIDLPANNAFKPGMFARALITTKTSLGVAIPQKAIIPQPDGSAIVFILSGEDTVTAQKVELGESVSGGKVEIKSGLQAGAQVVVDGAGYLKDGDRVRIAQSPTPKP
jgi:HlyD family secretion protein